MKKVLMALLAALMALCVFAGCTIQVGSQGGNTDEPSSSVNDKSEPDESEPEESEPDELDIDAYLAWDNEDWDNASDAEKENCALAYLLYVAELMGESDNVTADMLRPEVDDELVDTVGLMFGAIELGAYDTLKEAADTGFELLENE